MGGGPLDTTSGKIPHVCPKSPLSQLVPQGRFLGWSLRTPEGSPSAPGAGGGWPLPHLRDPRPRRGQGRGAEEPAPATPSPRGRAPLELAGAWGLGQGGPPSLSGSGKERHTQAEQGGLAAEPRAPRFWPAPPFLLTLAARLLLFQPETSGPGAILNLRRVCTPRT